MAQSGNWFPNLLNWFIGYFISALWLGIGQILALFGMWQMPHDAIISAMTQFKPTELSDKVFTTAYKLGN